MLDFFLWYIAISIVGWLAFPIAFRMLGRLPDRGLTLSRPLGMLLWGFAFWLLASFHILQNNLGGVLIALFILAGLAYWAGRDRWPRLFGWLREHLSFVLLSELLFLLAFAFLAAMRAADPVISGTEKPMELAFLNAILRSPIFPPADPWLSGYSISYYYFGYVLVAMLTRVTGVISGVAFNLGVSSWFAMTALGAFGLVYSLLSFWNRRNPGRRQVLAGLGALLAPLFLLLVSNLEGVLEVLHARGITWTQAADGTWHSAFFQWLNIQEICQPPALPFTWVPNRPGGIWWWRASRVLQDFDMSHVAQMASGQACVIGREVIDEFPFFSFLLSDMHPHVLAMPFALLVIGLALNLYFTLRAEPLDGEGVFHWIGSWMEGESRPWHQLTLAQWVRRIDFWLLALALGGMAFLNTWDFPIYVALAAATFTLVRVEQDGWKWRRFWEFVETGLALGLVGILMYLPFYIGFSSQAGGFLPSLSFFTRGTSFWIFFGPLLVPVLAWLVWLWRKRGGRIELGAGLKFAAITVGGLWAVSYLFSFVALSFPALGGSLMSSGGALAGLGNKLQSLGGLFIGLQYGADPSTVTNPYTVIGNSLLRRVESPGAWLTLFALVGLSWGLLASYRRESRRVAVEEPAMVAFDGADVLSLNQVDVAVDRAVQPSTDAFVLLLVLLGGGLTLMPEFFYLRDQFGTRMNTIFKFYFETWILWSIAGAYATAMLLTVLRGAWKVIISVGMVLLIAMGLVYTAFGLNMKFGGVNPADMTFDGTHYIQVYTPDEYAAYQFLDKAPYGVVAEAVGGSYNPDYARVATHTGLPDVLGWPGHESQWRGGGAEMGSRESDIKQLYETPSWQDAQSILQRYNIRYVFVGSSERNSYRVNETKFQQHLKPVFQQGSVTIYEAPDFNTVASNPGQ